MSEPIDVTVRDDGIRLGQFLKLASLVDTGGEAKEIIASGEVTVNGDVCTARGRHLRDGDVVAARGAQARVTTQPESA